MIRPEGNEAVERQTVSGEGMEADWARANHAWNCSRGLETRSLRSKAPTLNWSACALVAEPDGATGYDISSRIDSFRNQERRRRMVKGDVE